MLKAGFLQEVDGTAQYEPGPQLPKRKNWRYFKFGHPKQPHHCFYCNSTDHNISTCKKGSSDLRMKVAYQHKREEKKHRQWLYSGTRKRCASQRSRAVSTRKLSVSADELTGMDAAAIRAHAVRQGIFRREGEAQHIAFRRWCSGHGSIGLKKTLCAYWYLCRGKSVAFTMEALRLGETTCMRLQRHMLGAVFLDTLTLQSKNQWGTKGPKTVVLEGAKRVSRRRLN